MASTEIVATMADAFKNLPAEVLAKFANQFSTSFDAPPFTRLSLKGTMFSLAGATNTPLVGADNLPVRMINFIFIAEAPADHFVYYRGAYDANVEDVKPDAVWMDGDDFPASVPASDRVPRADGRKPYSRKRRTVILLVDPKTGQFMPEPVVFDVNASSLYGEDLDTGPVTYVHLRQWDKQHGLYPCAHMTSALFDTRAKANPCTLRFIPAADAAKNPIVLDDATMSWVIQKAFTDDVQRLLKIQAIDNSAAGGAPVQSYAQAAAQVQADLGMAPTQPAPTAPAAPAPAMPSAPVAPAVAPAQAVPSIPVAPVTPVAAPAAPAAPAPAMPSAPVAPVTAVPGTDAADAVDAQLAAMMQEYNALQQV